MRTGCAGTRINHYMRRLWNLGCLQLETGIRLQPFQPRLFMLNQFLVFREFVVSLSKILTGFLYFSHLPKALGDFFRHEPARVFGFELALNGNSFFNTPK